MAESEVLDEKSQAAKKGFRLALIGFFLGLIPFLPITLNGNGLLFSLKGLSSPRRKRAIFGLILASLGLIWNVWYGWATVNSLRGYEQQRQQQEGQV